MEDKLEYTNADILKIARKQQIMLWVYLFCLFLSVVPHSKYVVSVLFAIYIYQLANAMRSSIAWFYGIISIIPFVGFLTLISVNSQATAALRKRGIRIGIMGARNEDLSKFSEPKLAAQ